MKDILYFYRLSRPLNVLITQLAFSLGAFIALKLDHSFIEVEEFWYGLVALTVISATGYWVNDAYDFKIDRVNKPRKVIVNAHISVKKVLTGYFVAIGLVLIASLIFQEITLFLINATAVALLFGYAALLKRTTVIGNLVIASLTGMVIYYAGMIFGFRWPVIWTVAFAFEVTFLREVVKDMEDIKGDLKFKLNTLPIRAGIKSTKKVLYVAFAVFILTCNGPLVLDIINERPINLNYLAASIALVQIPAGLIIWQLAKAKSSKDFHRISTFLKGLVFLGMASVLFLK